MVAVPKKANDAMHLSLVEGLPGDAQGGALGEVLLQDAFLTWESRGLVRKGRERRAFLFEMYLLLAKEVKDSHGKAKYIYKNRLMVSTKLLHYFNLPFLPSLSAFFMSKLGHQHSGVFTIICRKFSYI